VLLRSPYGALNKPQHVWIPQRLKLNVIYWSVDTLDWKHSGAATITQRVLAGARPGAIILQHDIHAQTIDAMAAALDGLIAKGYRLVTVSELIAVEAPEVSPTPSPHVTSGRTERRRATGLRHKGSSFGLGSIKFGHSMRKS
jgi:hypothetical protein